MKHPGFYYYPVRILVTHKDRPVILNAALPANLTAVTGIRAIHSGGINLYSTADPAHPQWPVASIGWLNIAFNNRSLELGNLDVDFKVRPGKSDEYSFLDVSIPLEKNTIVTGVYNNIFDPADWNLLNTLQPGNDWINYVVTLYLQCTKDHD